MSVVKSCNGYLKTTFCVKPEYLMEELYRWFNNAKYKTVKFQISDFIIAMTVKRILLFHF